MRTLVVAIVLMAASIGYAGTITETGGDNQIAGAVFDNQVCSVWPCTARWCSSRFRGGSNGIYTHNVSCTTGGAVIGLHYLLDHLPEASVANGTSVGWRQKNVTAVDTCDKLQWTVQIRIKLTGSFDCSNDYELNKGDCNAYAWAKVVLSGKASGSAEVKGTLSATEGDDTISVTGGPVGLSASFSLVDSKGPFEGDDVMNSVSGSAEDAHVNDRIYLTGSVSSSGSVGDAAHTSEFEVKIIKDNFDLTLAP